MALEPEFHQPCVQPAKINLLLFRESLAQGVDVVSSIGFEVYEMLDFEEAKGKDEVARRSPDGCRFGGALGEKVENPRFPGTLLPFGRIINEDVLSGKWCGGVD